MFCLSKEYYHLRSEIDTVCHRLEELHSSFLVCASGCTGCCMDFSIFPVEFHSVFEEIKGKRFEYNRSASEGECIFLVDGLCSIYESRPVICRTHGLPLLSMGEEQWELNYCVLNFTEAAPEFDESNTFPQDRYNSMLFMLNKKFIESFKEIHYEEFELIPLKELSKTAQGSVRRAQG